MTSHAFITSQSVLSKLKGTKTQADKPRCANYDRWYLFLKAHKVWWKSLRDEGVFLWSLSVRINLQYLCDCKLLFAGVGPAYWMGLWTFITIDPDLTAICSAQSRSLMFQLHPSLPAKVTKLANGFSFYVFNYKILCMYANQHFQARLLNTNCRTCWVPTGAANITNITNFPKMWMKMNNTVNITEIQGKSKRQRRQ